MYMESRQIFMPKKFVNIHVQLFNHMHIKKTHTHTHMHMHKWNTQEQHLTYQLKYKQQQN